MEPAKLRCMLDSIDLFRTQIIELCEQQKHLCLDSISRLVTLADLPLHKPSNKRRKGSTRCWEANGPEEICGRENCFTGGNAVGGVQLSSKKKNATFVTKFRRKPLVDANRVTLDWMAWEADGEQGKDREEPASAIERRQDIFTTALSTSSLGEDPGASPIILANDVSSGIMPSKRLKGSNGCFTSRLENSFDRTLRQSCFTDEKNVSSAQASFKEKHATFLATSCKKPVVEAVRASLDALTPQIYGDVGKEDVICEESIKAGTVSPSVGKRDVPISLRTCSIKRGGGPSTLSPDPSSVVPKEVETKPSKRRKKPAGHIEPVVGTRMTRARAKILDNASTMIVGTVNQDDNKNSTELSRKKRAPAFMFEDIEVCRGKVLPDHGSIGVCPGKMLSDHVSIEVSEGKMLPDHQSSEDGRAPGNEELLQPTITSQSLLAGEGGATAIDLQVRVADYISSKPEEEQVDLFQSDAPNSSTASVKELIRPIILAECHGKELVAKENGPTVAVSVDLEDGVGECSLEDLWGSCKEGRASRFDEKLVPSATTPQGCGQQLFAKKDVAMVAAYTDLEVRETDSFLEIANEMIGIQVDVLQPYKKGSTAMLAEQVVHTSTTVQGHAKELLARDSGAVITNVVDLKAGDANHLLGNVVKGHIGHEGDAFQSKEEGCGAILGKELIQPTIISRGYDDNDSAHVFGEPVGEIADLKVRGSGYLLRRVTDEFRNEVVAFQLDREGFAVTDHEEVMQVTTTPGGHAEALTEEEGMDMAARNADPRELCYISKRCTEVDVGHKVDILPTPLPVHPLRQHQKESQDYSMEEVGPIDYARLYASVGCRSESRLVRLMSRKNIELSELEEPVAYAAGNAKDGVKRLEVFHDPGQFVGTVKKKVLSELRCYPKHDLFDSITKRNFHKRPREWCQIRTQLESKYVDHEMRSEQEVQAPQDLQTGGNDQILDISTEVCSSSDRLEKYATLSASKLLEMVSFADKFSPKSAKSLDVFLSAEKGKVEGGSKESFLNEHGSMQVLSTGRSFSRRLSGCLTGDEFCVPSQHDEIAGDAREGKGGETRETSCSIAEMIPSLGRNCNFGVLSSSNKLFHSAGASGCATYRALPSVGTPPVAKNFLQGNIGVSPQPEAGVKDKSLPCDVADVRQVPEVEFAADWLPGGDNDRVSDMSQKKLMAVNPTVVCVKDPMSSLVVDSQVGHEFTQIASNVCGLSPECRGRLRDANWSQQELDKSKPSFICDGKLLQEISSSGPMSQGGHGSIREASITSSLRQGVGTNSHMRSSNLISSMKTFVPVVQRPPPNFLPNGKRDIKVKALEVAEAAKHMEEKREAERREKLMKKAIDNARSAMDKERAKEEASRLQRESTEASKLFAENLKDRDGLAPMVKAVPLDSSVATKHIFSPEEKLRRAMASKSKINQEKVKKFKEEIRRKEERKKKLMAQRQQKEELEKKENAEKLKRQKDLAKQRKEQECRLRVEPEGKEHRTLDEPGQERKAAREEVRCADRERGCPQKDELESKASRWPGKEADHKKKGQNMVDGLIVANSKRGACQELRSFSVDVQLSDVVGTGSSMSAVCILPARMDGQPCMTDAPTVVKGSTLLEMDKNEFSLHCMGTPTVGALEKEDMGPVSYEITPYRESSDDEDEEQLTRPAKHIPFWSRKHNLNVQLANQMRQDPDEIFAAKACGQTCSLKDVFGTNGSKKVQDFGKRSGSGNWVEDHVSWKEELQYKISMGYMQEKHG